jgi:hypothetical protein
MNGIYSRSLSTLRVESGYFNQTVMKTDELAHSRKLMHFANALFTILLTSFSLLFVHTSIILET